MGVKWSERLKGLVLADLSPQAPPFSLGEWQTGAGPDQASPEESEPLDAGASDDRQPLPVTADLAPNVEWLKRFFSVPGNGGFVFRPVSLGSRPVDGVVAYLDDQVDWQHLEKTLLNPLMSADLPELALQDPESLIRQVLTGRAHAESDRYIIADAILKGSAVLLIDGTDRAIVVEARGWAKRAVTRPTAEQGVRGPQEGFTEDLRTNLSLVRRQMRTAELIVEWTQLGRLTHADVAVLYIKRVANAKLVAEVRRRIRTVDVDILNGSATVEQWLEDNPYSLFPTLVSTERPDRVTALLAEGYVAILVANTPYALILPGNITLFLHSPEDVYLRWPYATFVRLIRSVAFFTALLMPGIYVAIAYFHHEMVPTALMLAISGTRETVPLPVILEVVLMELTFELIREAGLRIPSVMGQTIGIVGALILGQAAVQAGLVSPILVILTAGTALASFAIPNYSMQFAVRIMRFGFIFAGAMLGLFGVTLSFLVLCVSQAGTNTFGVPQLSPFTPYRSWSDAVVRLPAWAQQRTETVRPKESGRQADPARSWAPGPMHSQGGETPRADS